ncbi:MAG: hypothetical protein AAF799_16965 [Myxococcota bacterium]
MVGCERTATNVPDEAAPAPAAKDWEPPEGDFGAERVEEEEEAPFLSAR